MTRAIDLEQLRFGQPDYLWLLILPALLVVALVIRSLLRRRDTHRLARERLVPVRERFALVGDLPFWLCLIAAVASLVIALARPYGPSTAVRRGGVDLVILLDGSASMRVEDVPGNRWQRAVRFVRVIGNALGWNNDRVALNVFAYIASPQVRLTKDPNTLFFFLDHLDEEPPFRLEEETTWDTNVELGINWGLRMLERDEEMNGRSPNAKQFVLITDGETWSGEVEHAIEAMRDRGVPLYVVGVGTLGGGLLPDVKGSDGSTMLDEGESRLSQLDRASLQQIASRGAGEYFELDRDGDQLVANRIIDAGRRLAPTLAASEAVEEQYWRFLAAAAGLIGLGLLFLRERAELWLQLTATAATLAWLLAIF